MRASETFEQYLRGQLSRTDPHPAIDHRLRAELHADGRISFYIHPDGRDGETPSFWVEGEHVSAKRLSDEPLSEELRALVLERTRKYGTYWGHGDNQRLIVDSRHSGEVVAGAIETIDGVTANCEGCNDDHYVFRPHLG